MHLKTYLEHDLTRQTYWDSQKTFIFRTKYYSQKQRHLALSCAEVLRWDAQKSCVEMRRDLALSCAEVFYAAAVLQRAPSVHWIFWAIHKGWLKFVFFFPLFIWHFPNLVQPTPLPQGRPKNMKNLYQFDEKQLDTINIRGLWFLEQFFERRHFFRLVLHIFEHF